MPSAAHNRQPEFTLQAEYDLEQVEEFISQDNPQAARRIIERIRDLCFTLAEQPHMGVSRPQFGLAQSLEQSELALQLIEQGKSVQEIAKTFGVERTTIYRLQAA